MLSVAFGKRRFWKDERGNVALAFGLALVPMVGAAGTALDYQSASNTRNVLQSEADAAALEVMKAVVEVQTSSANANKTQSERSAMIEQRTASILAARQAIAQARTSDRATGVAMAGRWEDSLKTEYTFTASGNVKRLFMIAGVGGQEPVVPVKISATAKMEVQTSTSTAVPTLANPGYEAGDYNRIYAYCYDDKKKNEASRGRSKMTPISTNGTSGSYVELTSGAAFRNVQMPACEGNEVLSWRLYNVRGQRTNSNAWPRDTYNSTTKLWSQTDRSGYEIYNHYSDTKINGNSGLEDYAFRGDAFGYNAPIRMMETVVCDTLDQCTPADRARSSRRDATAAPIRRTRPASRASSCSWAGRIAPSLCGTRGATTIRRTTASSGPTRTMTTSRSSSPARRRRSRSIRRRSGFRSERGRLLQA